MALELPGYQFIEKIGEGGMATVYRGVQQSLKRSVAIKVLNAQLRQHDEVRRAFEVESLIIARLSHPNIVPVVDRGVSERGTPFFIMEFIKGQDLAA
ncbi:MAG: protein kinase, partial [Pseudomonadota bacterium]|nr:protein kinase [Pseudomonadota bacterium]